MNINHVKNFLSGIKHNRFFVKRNIHYSAQRTFHNYPLLFVAFGAARLTTKQLEISSLKRVLSKFHGQMNFLT